VEFLLRVLCYNCEWNFFSHSFTIETPMADMDNRDTCVIQIYQQRVYSKPCVPSATFGRPKLVANGVANKLFMTFLLSDPDFGLQFLKDVGLIQRNMVCCKCGSQMAWCVDTNRSDGYRWQCRGRHVLPCAPRLRQSVVDRNR
jgi:hypothetical protein